MTSMYTILY